MKHPAVQLSIIAEKVFEPAITELLLRKAPATPFMKAAVMAHSTCTPSSIRR